MRRITTQRLAVGHAGIRLTFDWLRPSAESRQQKRFCGAIAGSHIHCIPYCVYPCTCPPRETSNKQPSTRCYFLDVEDVITAHCHKRLSSSIAAVRQMRETPTPTIIAIAHIYNLFLTTALASAAVHVSTAQGDYNKILSYVYFGGGEPPKLRCRAILSNTFG
jgi:hypothetical protein